MLSIHLHNLHFRAYHGLYEHEKISGNDFEVNVEAKYLPSQKINSLEQTVNYEKVFRLIESRMQIATPLLETIVMEIAQQILERFALVEEVFVSIKKLNPPIEGMKGSVGISYTLKRK